MFSSFADCLVQITSLCALKRFESVVKTCSLSLSSAYRIQFENIDPFEMNPSIVLNRFQSDLSYRMNRREIERIHPLSHFSHREAIELWIPKNLSTQPRICFRQNDQAWIDLDFLTTSSGILQDKYYSRSSTASRRMGHKGWGDPSGITLSRLLCNPL